VDFKLSVDPTAACNEAEWDGLGIRFGWTAACGRVCSGWEERTSIRLLHFVQFYIADITRYLTSNISQARHEVFANCPTAWPPVCPVAKYPPGKNDTCRLYWLGSP